MDKYLSIITNFGCHYSCPYCIVKNNNLHIPETTIQGLNNLLKEIENNRCNWVSISGGGDPLWDFSNHVGWYTEFLDIVPSHIKIELHTSLIDTNIALVHAFDRVVYHLHDFEQLKKIQKRDEIVRVVFVVTEDFTEDLINKIAVYCYNSDVIDELSFRQMVDGNYEATDYCKDYLKAGHRKLWWYIEQCDYNLYYAENKVYTEFRKIGED